MKKITLLLCDDHNVVRAGLLSLLKGAEDIEVIGQAENGPGAVAEAARLQPDVILMDIAMPLLNGVEATRRIVTEFPAAKVLMLSSYDDDQHLQQAVAAGAAGYLLKETAAEDLLLAIHEIAVGNAFFSPAVVKRLSDQRRNRGVQSDSTPASPLTTRQREVVQLIGEGYSSKQMADLLGLSVKTVEKHRQAVMATLDLHKIAALTHYAIAQGMIETRAVASLLVSPLHLAGETD
jgi:DNA-binding NarL/FixJ family response regulator